MGNDRSVIVGVQRRGHARGKQRPDDIVGEHLLAREQRRIQRADDPGVMHAQVLAGKEDVAFRRARRVEQGAELSGKNIASPVAHSTGHATANDSMNCP